MARKRNTVRCVLPAIGLALQVLAATSLAQVDPFPLEPPDTSSPRATIESFMGNSARGTEAFRRGEGRVEILPWFERANRCLDVSEVSPDRVRVAATEAGLLLYEVLNRAGLPDTSEIPGEAEAEQKDLRFWKIPRTEITLVRVDEGERIGEFLFGPQTVARALEFYEKVKRLPHTTDYAHGTYEEYVTRPDFSIRYLWADELPSWAQARFFRNPAWKLLVLLITLTFGVFAAILVRRLGRGWDGRFGQRGGQWRVGTLAFAMSLVVLPILLTRFLGGIVGVRFDVQAIISKSLFTLAFVAAVYAVFALFEFIAEVIVSSRYLSEKSFNAPLVRVTSRLFAILASIFIIVRAAEYLGIQVGPVLAGLGIGGLAVALAARPTLENVIGGFTLFADKPVRVGDWCRFGDEEGRVEEIGLRSTRIRKRSDVLVTVPNADFSQMQLQNSERILQRVYHETLGLRYETTPDQLRYLLAKLREMLIGHPKVSPYRLHVRFRGFGAYSLDVEVFARTHTTDFLEFKAIREDIHLRIMDIVNEAGTGFAFPSQTNYFARDAGLDADRSREAEAKVSEWRLKGKLPFPEIDMDERKRIEDTLDYPPEGSPKHKPREET